MTWNTILAGSLKREKMDFSVPTETKCAFEFSWLLSADACRRKRFPGNSGVSFLPWRQGVWHQEHTQDTWDLEPYIRSTHRISQTWNLTLGAHTEVPETCSLTSGAYTGHLRPLIWHQEHTQDTWGMEPDIRSTRRGTWDMDPDTRSTPWVPETYNLTSGAHTGHLNHGPWH